MRRIVKGMAALAALTAVLATAGWMWLSATAATVSTLPPLKDGDIVFQSNADGQGLAVMMASASLYTHVGIVEVSDGEPRVVEAVGPVLSTPLERWIAHGVGGRITVKRVKGLSEAQARAALAAAHTYDGAPYDTFFYEDAARIYCSELVYRAFREGPGLTLGKVEQVRNLNLDNAAVRNLIRLRWQDHPVCQTAATRTFDSCYQKILEQTLVTPESVARDPKLETVFSNFGSKGS